MACRQVYPAYLEVINRPRQIAEAFVGRKYEARIGVRERFRGGGDK
jgi:hypothetical protein